jgi:hypothetical protein
MPSPLDSSSQPPHQRKSKLAGRSAFEEVDANGKE